MSTGEAQIAAPHAMAHPGSLARSEPFAVVRLMGVRLHAARENEVNEHIVRESLAGRGGVVITPNLDHLRRAVADADYRAMIERAELSVPDGMPLILCSRLQGTPLPQRVAGSDMISSLSERACRDGLSVFLLGGDAGTAERAARVLRDRNPALRVAGTYCPEFGFEKDAEQMRAIIEALRTASPDIVFVGLGSPKQERLIERLRSELPRAWWLGVGISFSFLCGEVRRAPVWMRRCGLEWLHRLISEPGRLFRRYVIDGLPFGMRLIGASLLARLRAGGNDRGASRGDGSRVVASRGEVSGREDSRARTHAEPEGAQGA